MFTTNAYASLTADAPLAPHLIQRRDPGPTDVVIEILFCGVCHSDLHTARNEWGGSTLYPCVPGHEIVGRVTAVGADVTAFKVGQLAAVGCLVGSCRSCASCRDDQEQYCEVGFTMTYNSADPDVGHTLGGYAKHITVEQHFVLNVPENLDPAATAPLLCAGITTYSPLRHWKVGPGQKVGIAGLGGLGHMGVKFAAAMGAHTVVLTTSASKVEDARRLGAHDVIVTRDADAMAAHAGSFDFILNTIAADHDINAYLNLLKRDATLCQVGAPPAPLATSAFSVIFKRRSFAGSLIGGLKETQEMLDFCSEHNIVCDIEMIRMDEVNEAYERMLKNDVRYRFVIDMSTLTATA